MCVPLPFQGRLFYSGSPLGELAPQVTEGLVRKSFTLSKRFHIKIPPPPNGGSPPFSREAFYSGSPLGELAPQVTEGLVRKSFTSNKRLQQYPSTAYSGSPPLKGRLFQTPKTSCNLQRLSASNGKNLYEVTKILENQIASCKKVRFML